MSDTHARRGQALLWIFALSGFSGLVYQSIWTQYLGLFLGHSAHAQSLVLVLFMGGMALGAWYVSRRSESMRRPLLAYAVVELAIGVAGLLFDHAYQAGTGWAYELMQATGAAQGIRWSMATLLVLPQCILLGATFPLMSAGFMRLQPAAEGRILAGLYFSNSIGAALGALVATYFLLPRIGLPGVILTAGLLNIFVAIAIYPLAKVATPLLAVSKAEQSRRVHAPTMILAVAALTGATSFVYEITWIRMLSLALGTTLHAFELMLAAFIAGIAFGGLWLRNRADRMTSPLATAGWVQVWMGLAALASMFVYANAFEWVGWLMRTLAHTSEGYVAYNVASGAISLLVMFPAAFCAGMTLPLLTLALLRQGGGERVIGHVYAVNTLGAIAGVLVAVHLLLPLLGLKLAMWLAAAVDLLLGITVLILVDRRHAKTRWAAPAWAGVLAALGLGVSMWAVHFDPGMLASSVYRHGTTSLGDAKVLFYRDGKTASVSVYENSAGRRSIATNGKVDAGLMMDPSSRPSSDEYTMALLAALPLSMRERYDRVGVIGFGSGMTTHYLLGSTRVGRVDTVEIEPMMVEAARLFGKRVHRAFDDPRSHVVIDDAKSYFSAAGTQYDLIVSEPSNPWMGGTASLFSDEFYRFIPRHLAKDGLFVQWLQLYEIDAPLVSSVLAAMLGNFEDVQAYIANGGDLILVASPRGSVPAAAGRVFNDAALWGELARLGIRNARDLRDGFLLDRRGLEAYASLNPVQANSDFFPILQLNAPVARFMNRSVDLASLQASPWPLSGYLGGISPRGRDEPPPAMQRPFPLDARQKTARQLREVMVGGSPPKEGAIDPDALYRAQALRSVGSECLLDEGIARNLDLLFSVAGDTLPFLSSPEQTGLWRDPTWVACAPKDPLLLDGLALVNAASAHDHAKAIVHARALLDSPKAALVTDARQASRFVAGTMFMATLASNDPDEAKALYREYWEKLPQATRDDEAIRLLVVLATTQRPSQPGEPSLATP